MNLEMSDRYRHSLVLQSREPPWRRPTPLANWARIISGAVARQTNILAKWARIVSRAVTRQNTITDGLRAWVEWSSIRTKFRRDRAARNWDFFRGFAIPTMRHFLSYERKGHYGWTGRASRNPFRSGNPIRYYSPSDGHFIGMMDRSRWDKYFWFLSLEHPYFRWGPRSRLIFRPGVRLSGPNNPLSGRRHVSARQHALWARMGQVTVTQPNDNEDEGVTEI